MKKLIFLFLIIQSFFACTSDKKDNEISIFNNISFGLVQGESLVEITPRIKENYFSYFKNTNLQVPLLKCIKNKDYTIYLGIPYNTSIQEIFKFEIVGQDFKSTVLESDTNSFVFKNHNNDSIYISEYSKLFDKNLIYVLAITNSKIISDTLFNQAKLTNRFN